jgi:hypothetical protein
MLGSEFLPTPHPTNPELEKTAREDGTLGVYTDWLLSQGAPIGEYIALAAALEQQDDAQKRARFDELAKAIALPTREFATWGTKHGYFTWLRFENVKDWMSSKFDAGALAKRVFATPLCAVLDELRLGVLRWEFNNVDVPAVIGAAAEFPWARSLSRLHLGDVEEIDMDHHIIGAVGEPIARAFPNLTWLKVHSGAQGDDHNFSLAGLALPKLETLVVETCSMTSQRLADLLAADLPALTHLELWFGGTDRDAGATLDDLAPLLDGKVFPKLTHLGLKNLDFSSALAQRLTTSAIRARLVELDLGMGTLGDDDVPTLKVLGETIASIGIDDSYFSEEALVELGPKFTWTQHDRREYQDDGRYASVVE